MGAPTTELTMTAAEQVLAIEEIKRVFAMRLRVMDTKQWDLYGPLHTEDVVTETWAGLPGDKQPKSDGQANRASGREHLTNSIRGMLGSSTHVTTAHHGHTPEIVLTSDTTATGIWAMEDGTVVDQRRCRGTPPRLRPLPRGVPQGGGQVADSSYRKLTRSAKPTRPTSSTTWEPCDHHSTGHVALFTPLTVRSLELRKRIAMSPMTRHGSPGGVPTDEVVAYYRRRAEGGTGLIVTEGVAIEHPSAVDADTVPVMYGEAALAGWRKVVDAVHAAGGKIVPQLWHVGPLFGAMGPVGDVTRCARPDTGAPWATRCTPTTTSSRCVRSPRRCPSRTSPT